MNIIQWLRKIFSDNATPTEVVVGEEQIEDKEQVQDEPKIYYTVAGHKGRPEEVVEQEIVKSKRRALRHFNGKEVKHRATEKSKESISFSFKRRTGNPTKITWHKKTSS